MESKTLAAGTAEPERPARSGLFSWYAAAQPRERRAFWSCKVGYMLDGIDWRNPRHTFRPASAG